MNKKNKSVKRIQYIFVYDLDGHDTYKDIEMKPDDMEWFIEMLDSKVRIKNIQKRCIDFVPIWSPDETH